MHNDAFYQGLLFELNKNAGVTDALARGLTGGVSGAATAANSIKPPSPAPAPNDAPPAPAPAPAQQKAPASAPAPAAQQKAPPPSPGTTPPNWYDLDRKANGLHAVANASRIISPLGGGIMGEVTDRLGQRLVDKKVQSGITDRINNAGITDAFSQRTPEEQQALQYAMSRPEVASKVQGTLADKTYGAASLNDKGELQMGGAPGGFQWKNFLNDNWGKILMALLGVGALGWLGNRGGGDGGGNTVVNNYGGQPQ